MTKRRRRMGSASAAQGPYGVEKEELESLAVREAVEGKQLIGGCNSLKPTTKQMFSEVFDDVVWLLQFLLFPSSGQDGSLYHSLPSVLTFR